MYNTRPANSERNKPIIEITRPMANAPAIAVFGVARVRAKGARAKPKAVASISIRMMIKLHKPRPFSWRPSS
ncbi:hypothetical protein D3C81_2312630 [compost metagenome]